MAPSDFPRTALAHVWEGVEAAETAHAKQSRKVDAFVTQANVAAEELSRAFAVLKADPWNIECIEDVATAHEYYSACFREYMYGNLCRMATLDSLAAAQDRYNQLVEDLKTISHSENLDSSWEEDDGAADADDREWCEWFGLKAHDCADLDVTRAHSRKHPALKVRHTRKDVLTPEEAIKAHKADKTHKLKPRSPRKDATKTREEKCAAKKKCKKWVY